MGQPRVRAERPDGEFLGYRFKDQTLLERALTHRSAAGEHNERLEFLGDALIGFMIADYLFNRFPDADEGALTRTRATLVNRDSLAAIARGLDLGAHLRLGEGELKSGGWRRDSILANCFEALVGAVFLDGGMEACRERVDAWFAERFATIDPKDATKDPKTQLQEYLQSRRHALPAYRTLDVSGPPHNQTFLIECAIPALDLAVEAEGKSRRRAEQEAARLALAAAQAQFVKE
ncbi:MAG: ribonuclease III [Gammaproteobacteria bacterium]|nr:ribonuclease III [Gammaproteobacteria bacterium]